MTRPSPSSTRVRRYAGLMLLFAGTGGCAGASAAPDVTAVAARDDGAVAPQIASAFALVRGELSGERALATVAAVEGKWRLPGNTGFNESIDHIVAQLRGAGYVEEGSTAATAPLVYRVERRPMAALAWEPVDASLTIVGADSALLRFATNRNMLAINSASTPAGGIEAEVVDAGRGTPEELDARSVRGRVVLAEAPVGRLYTEAVVRRGAVGVLSYNLPAYLQPERHVTSIQFGSIPQDTSVGRWGVLLSHAARAELRRAMARGPVRVRVAAATRLYASEERAVVAEVRGRTLPAERFVFSAHVQEPGANDNASGVGAQVEMARTLARLVAEGRWRPERTVTFLWGDEIDFTRAFLADDSLRASRVRWGMSLDMVGQNTAITGGSFLIEKHPDPSAIWTRGEDRHSEWGGSPIEKSALMPHYLNDFVIARCREQGGADNWTVNTNPYEGGSDHIPFLRAGIPAVLLWHFTDVFYHTDNDRLANVSPRTLANVGRCALVSAMLLASADGETARFIADEVAAAAERRLTAEGALGRVAIASGATRAAERDIVETWASWYRAAVAAVAEVEAGGSSPETRAAITAAAERISAAAAAALRAVDR